jgi:RHS repeat-associated protein
VQAYGGAESDYRPGRWKEFREDYRFTGKEEDVEVGLQYFGKRFYAPLLQRWISPDPLTIHGLGGDLNAYAYVSGRALQATDPLGLDNESVLAEDVPLEGGTSGDMCAAQGACASKVSDAPNASTAPPPRAQPGPAKQSPGTGGTGPTIDKDEILAKFDPIVDRSGNMRSLKAPYGGTLTVNLMEEQLERLTASGGVQGSSGSGELPEVPRLQLKIAEFEPVIIQAAAPGPRPALALGAGELRAATLDVSRISPTMIGQQAGPGIVVPRGAVGPTAVESGRGVQYVGGSGGPGLSSRVSNVRIMEPTAPSGPSPGYPRGYASYSNASRQTVNPATGQTVPKSSPWWHIPLDWLGL